MGTIEDKLYDILTDVFEEIFFSKICKKDKAYKTLKILGFQAFIWTDSSIRMNYTLAVAFATKWK